LRLTGSLPVIAVLMVGLGQPVRTAEVEKKFRISLALGMFNTRDEIRSDAANVLNLTEPSGMVVDSFTDPRADSAITGNLEVKPGALGTIAVQYAPNRFTILEASIGYHEPDIGELEVQYQDIGGSTEVITSVNMTPVRVPVGKLTRIPIQLSSLFRFRPRSSFNPYCGVGIGYSVIGFETAPEFDQLSLNLDMSQGVLTRLSSDSRGGRLSADLSQIGDFSGASVQADDTFEVDLIGGAEYGFGEHWSAFVDFRYAFTSRQVEIRFDGQQNLGNSVPAGSTPEGSEQAEAIYGPVFLVFGGAILDDSGEPVSGLYYMKGGLLKLDGFSAQFGMRYTF